MQKLTVSHFKVPSDTEFIINPYPLHELLRNEDPLHRSPLSMWIISCYNNISNEIIAGYLWLMECSKCIKFQRK